MAVYLKKFETQPAYEAAQSSLILPNVSLTVDNNTVHYNPSTPPTPVETRLVAKYNVTSTSHSTILCNYYDNFSAMEIDGVGQSEVVDEYTFDTLGEHTVKYTLTDPTSIGENAFMGCYNLTNVTIPNSVTSIGEGAFSDCSGLTSIDIPNSVTSISSLAFNDCSGLTSCTIGSGVTSIGIAAFNSCTSITSIDIPNSVTSIGNNTFFYCANLTTCTIGSGVTSIGNSAFAYCSGLTSIDIPSGVTSIGGSAFAYCSGLTSITSNRTTAPTIQNTTFQGVKTNGTLTVPQGSSGYNTWMQNANYYLGLYNWTKVEQ